MKGTGAVPVIRVPPRADVGATGSILPAERVRREPVAGVAPGVTPSGGGTAGSAGPDAAVRLRASASPEAPSPLT
ncbi:hypothetical protein GCM10018789_13540 [Streptomyces werraensis]|nr:hypothetical protein GCM10018789_13540 [Streptomyces werraensis]